MTSLVLTGDTSGQVTLAAPAVAGSNTLTLQAATATNAVNTLSTAVSNPTSPASASIDFTGLPSWIKRITVQFQGTSLSSTGSLLVQLGTGSTTYTTSGYLSTGNAAAGGGNSIVSSTAGFIMVVTTAVRVTSGHMVITNISGNNWVASHTGKSDTATVLSGGGDVSLGAVLTAVRITSTGADTFDAGTVNILYEG